MNSPSAKPSRSLWPHAITAWFVVLASALAAWVAFAVRQNMDLVRADYYEEEIRFQQQLDRLNRTAPLRAEVAVRYDAVAREITLRLPAAHLEQSPTGRLQFYRPSDAALDFELPLAVDARGVQRIDVRRIRPGHWKIRAQWKAGKEGYFVEQPLVLDEPGRTLTDGATEGK